jgi:hypothetical protein
MFGVELELCDLCRDEKATAMFPICEDHLLSMCADCIAQAFIEQCLPEEG